QVIQRVEGVPSLFVLPGGPLPPNPAELVERQAFGLLMQELVSKFDHVVVDTPVAAIGVGWVVVAARCGSDVLFGGKNASVVNGMQDLLASLTGSGVDIVGAIVNEF